MHIACLPNEIICLIFSEHLDVCWFIVCHFVCRTWHELLNSNGVNGRAKMEALYKHCDTKRHVTCSYHFDGLKKRTGPVCYLFAWHGSIGCLQWAKANGAKWVRKTIFEQAAAGGHKDVILWMKENEERIPDGKKVFPFGTDICDYAALGGHLELLKWARHSENCLWDETTSENAAEGGHPRIVRWLEANCCPIDKDAICWHAAKRDDMAMLKWAFFYDKDASAEEIKTFDEENMIIASDIMRRGEVSHKVAEWLCSRGAVVYPTLLCSAMRNFDSQFFQWIINHMSHWPDVYTMMTLFTLATEHPGTEKLELLQKSKFAFDEQTFIEAATRSDLDTLRWLHAQGCPWSECTYSMLASRGDIKMLEWAREKGCPWNSDTYVHAASKGHMHVIDWAYSNGCPTDGLTCACAINHDNVNFAKWMASKGVPWGEDTSDIISRCNCIEIIRWALSDSCPYSADKIINQEIVYTLIKNGDMDLLIKMESHIDKSAHELHEIAASSGDVRILEWLIDDCSMIREDVTRSPELFYKAMCVGNIDVLDWLLSRGFIWHDDAIHGAMQRKQLNTIEWAIRHGLTYIHCEGCILDNVRNSHIDVLDYLMSCGKCQLNEQMLTNAIALGNLKSIKWLHKHKCPFHESACQVAIDNRRFDVLLWLINNGFQLSGQAKISARETTHLKIKELLIKKDLLN